MDAGFPWTWDFPAILMWTAADFQVQNPQPGPKDIAFTGKFISHVRTTMQEYYSMFHFSFWLKLYHFDWDEMHMNCQSLGTLGIRMSAAFGNLAWQWTIAYSKIDFSFPTKIKAVSSHHVGFHEVFRDSWYTPYGVSSPFRLGSNPIGLSSLWICGDFYL